MLNEKVFYQDNNVLVTQARIVAFGKTYAMRNISSVGMSQNSKLSPKIASTIIFVFALVGLYLKEYWMGVTVFGIAVIILLNARNEYVMIISSNSGDNNALSSKNRDYIQSVMDAINEVIVHRG